MSEYGLFDDILSELPSGPASAIPLGGVHRDVVGACAPWPKHVTSRWGTTIKTPHWRYLLENPEISSLEDIKNREDIAESVSIVSRESAGGAWLTGAAGLRREDVLQVLADQGYIVESDENDGVQRIERFRRRG
jgi:hypothetical protein